jgi:isochorismate synthase
MPAQSQQQQKLFGLALSVKRGETPRSEASDEILNIVNTMSEKEIEEQKPVSSYIRNVLEKFNSNSEIQESETYDHISGNIKHLRTDFKARINPENLGSIIQQLHPTPAVCGIPKDFCKEKIR